MASELAVGHKNNKKATIALNDKLVLTEIFGRILLPIALPGVVNI